MGLTSARNVNILSWRLESVLNCHVTNSAQNSGRSWNNGTTLCIENTCKKLCCHQLIRVPTWAPHASHLWAESCARHPVTLRRLVKLEARDPWATSHVVQNSSDLRVDCTRDLPDRDAMHQPHCPIRRLCQLAPPPAHNSHHCPPLSRTARLTECIMRIWDWKSQNVTPKSFSSHAAEVPRQNRQVHGRRL